MRKLWIMASVFCIVLLSLIFFNYVIEKEEYKNVVGISIAFEENATENEVRSILDSYNLTLPYELDYNITNTRPIFYSTISDADFESIENSLSEEDVGLSKMPKKRNGQIVVLIEGLQSDNQMISITESHNVSLKRLVRVDIFYKGSAISYDDGIILRDNLWGNNKIIFTHLITRKP